MKQLDPLSDEEIKILVCQAHEAPDTQGSHASCYAINMRLLLTLAHERAERKHRAWHVRPNAPKKLRVFLLEELDAIGWPKEER